MDTTASVGGSSVPVSVLQLFDDPAADTSPDKGAWPDVFPVDSCITLQHQPTTVVAMYRPITPL